MLTISILNKRENNKTSLLRLCQSATLFTIFAVAMLPCMAQQPFQDAKGEGTLLINGGGFAQINIADPSIRFGYLHDNSDTDLTYGFNLSGKLTGTRASFINNNRVAPDAQFAFTIGKKYFLTKKFEPEKITVDEELLSNLQKILREKKIIEKDATLPSRNRLETLLNNVKVLQTKLKNLLRASGEREIITTLPVTLENPVKLLSYYEKLIDFCDGRLKNENIIQLLRKGVAKDIILQIINTSPNAFDVKETTINSLKELTKTVPDSANPNVLVEQHLFPDDIVNAMKDAATAVREEDKFCGIKGADQGAIFSFLDFGYDRLVFQGGYGFRQYNLFDPTAPLDKQIYKKDFHSPSAQLIYFRLIGGNKLFGASAGVQRSNNSNDLTEVDVRDFTSTITNGTTREVGRTRKALRGDFKQATRTFINTDFAWFPSALDSRIGINFFTRSGLTGFEKGFRPGVGLFFSEKGAPTRVIGGVSVSLEKQKPNVALIAGFNF